MSCTSPGADKATVQHAIAAVLPRGVEVVTGQTVANEQSNDINQALCFFSTALLVFAFISLFVGGFTIFNTFSITVGQRTRELALLRIVGASRRQVFRSVLAEALILGTVASLIGIGLGVLAAIGLEALFKGLGITLPSGSLIFEGRTVVVALLVGVGVTLISAISPARRAVRIPPVAALADHRTDEQESSRRRIVVGSVFAVVGVALLVLGLTEPAIQLVGVGAVALFIGIGMLAPVVARPMASVIGRPLARIRGFRESSVGRTGCAAPGGRRRPLRPSWSGWPWSRPLPCSARRSQVRDEQCRFTISASYIVTVRPGRSRGISAVRWRRRCSAARRHIRLHGLSGDVRDTGSLANLTAVSTRDLSSTVILRMQSGAGARPRGRAVAHRHQHGNHETSGGRLIVPVKFAQTGTSTLRVGGIFQPNALIGSYLVGDRYFLDHFNNFHFFDTLIRIPTHLLFLHKLYKVGLRHLTLFRWVKEIIIRP